MLSAGFARAGAPRSLTCVTSLFGIWYLETFLEPVASLWGSLGTHAGRCDGVSSTIHCAAGSGRQAGHRRVACLTAVQGQFCLFLPPPWCAGSGEFYRSSRSLKSPLNWNIGQHAASTACTLTQLNIQCMCSLEPGGRPRSECAVASSIGSCADVAVERGCEHRQKRGVVYRAAHCPVNHGPRKAACPFQQPVPFPLRTLARATPLLHRRVLRGIPHQRE